MNAASSPSEWTANAACIESEIAWFGRILDLRFDEHAGKEVPADLPRDVPPPALPASGAPYADLVRRLELDAAERLLLVLAFLPHFRPQSLDAFFLQNNPIQRRFTEFGGHTGNSHGGFLPTGETAMFLIAGPSSEARLRHYRLFEPGHRFYTRGVLRLESPEGDEPRLAEALVLTPEYQERLTTGRSYKPPFSSRFPALRLATRLDWDDLVLAPSSRRAVDEIGTWLRHRQTLMDDWGLDRRLKPGYRALFHGPPGTGKTLTASLLGKATGRPVYRVDLAKLVSKWIGETEKNLASLLDQAENQDWILFFDEAESLFGKRTATKSSNDRFANQQVAYLLQRIEDYPGVVLLATNLDAHMDEAFRRRFQAMIHFPLPDAEARLRLWRENFEGQAFALAEDVDLEELAREHELSGGDIVNVLRYAALEAVTRQPPEVRAGDLARGIRRELHKDGRFLDRRSGAPVSRPSSRYPYNRTPPERTS